MELGGNGALGYKMKPYLENLLRQKGFKGDAGVAAAGIIGNLGVESAWFDPNVIAGKRRGDGGKAKGLAQWHPDRWSFIEDAASSKGMDPYTWEGQLVGLVEELFTKERSALKELEGAKSIQDAAQAFLHYERPAGFSRKDNGAGVSSLSQRQEVGLLFGGSSQKDSWALSDLSEPSSSAENVPSAADTLTEDEKNFLGVYGLLDRSSRKTQENIFLENLVTKHFRGGGGSD